ncbi:MAG: hypothetical protein P8R42_22570 [Candidatus Binatia bacterium]|nr:hypothetical protein [Candidatus Binatia bacterium]
MANEWWQQLPADERREYQRSEKLSKVPLPPDPCLGKIALAIDRALASENRLKAEGASQALVDRLSRRLSMPSATIRVQGRRPPDGEGELHGIYRPAEGTEQDQISVWMRTAKRADVVATRTFLRTLLHEVGHHLDMRLLDLPNSYHSRGFYQREAYLFRIITKGTALAPGGTAESPREPAVPPPQVDVQRGLALLRATVDKIEGRSQKEES